MADEIEICKAPDPFVFRVSGFGSFFFAKHAEGEDEHLVLFGTISMIGNGIELLAYEKMKSKKMHQILKHFEEKSIDTPNFVDSSVDELKKYLFGAYAFGLSRSLIEKTKEAMNSFEMLGGFTNEMEWLDNLVNNDFVLKKELVSLINKYGRLKDKNMEEAVFTKLKLRIAANNINEIIDNLSASGLFVMTESNSKESVLDLIKPADPKLVEQIKRYLKSGKKESIPRRGIEAEDVDLSTLIISKDGKEIYKEIAELTLGKNGKVEITANTISGASAALEQLIKAGAHNLTLESASYQHWKDLL
jgi:hypothetical protein